MGIELQTVVEADLRRCAEIEDLAFAESPLKQVLFSGPLPENMSEVRADEMAKQLREDATVRMFKAVDTALSGDEAIIGWCKFNVHADGMPEPKPREVQPWYNEKAYRMMFGGLDEMRKRLMAGKPSVYIHILVTDPKHQRRGAGLQLMTPGMQEGARLGVPVYLESSAAGHHLYTKLGFKDVEERRVDFSSLGVDLVHLNWAMIWEPPSQRCP
ncbi:acetyltransferase [Colletotrichum navitas]|uniref:Acetyltransferase n=1 Tax=Colletotrichum navitas TaxID=681940 RepID=A0AAD8V383_9PEZI|nr:acetyltransferase [Colletotrichum navitas]KAK1585577.1 acetyltransferase [Colletotrichum navitas]